MNIRVASALFLPFLSVAVVIAQDRPPATNVVLGQVVDAVTSRPIIDAVVSIVPRPRRVLTSADGYFVFRDLPAGSYGLLVEKPGFADGAFGRRRPNGPTQSLTIKDGTRTGDIVIRMWKHGAISGMVMDESGEALVGVQVRCWRRTSAVSRWGTCATLATTDDRGIYRLAGLIPGEYVVVTSGREVALPVALADRATPATGPPPGPPSANSIRVGESMYVLGRGAPIPPPPSGGRMFVYPSTFHPATTRPGDGGIIVIGSGDERSGVDLQLQPVPALRVSGTLIASDGTASGMPLRLVPAGSGELPVDQNMPVTLTDQSGAFTFPAVPPGQYQLRAAPEPRMPPGSADRREAVRWADVPLTVESADVDGVALMLRPGLTISGRMEFEGTLARPSPEQLRRVAIEIEAADRNPIVRVQMPSARKDDSGRFTSVGLATGRYYVRVLGSPTGWMFKSAMFDAGDVSITPLELGSDNIADVVLTFTDRWTSLSGVVQSATGNADDGAVVLVYPIQTDLWPNLGMNPRRMRTVRTSPGGSYNIPSVPIGDYFVVAIPGEHESAWQDLKFLETMARHATLVSIGDGEHKVQNLRTQEVR